MIRVIVCRRVPYCSMLENSMYVCVTVGGPVMYSTLEKVKCSPIMSDHASVITWNSHFSWMSISLQMHSNEVSCLRVVNKSNQHSRP